MKLVQKALDNDDVVRTTMVVKNKDLSLDARGHPNKKTSEIIKEARLGINVDDLVLDELK